MCGHHRPVGLWLASAILRTIVAEGLLDRGFLASSPARQLASSPARQRLPPHAAHAACRPDRMEEMVSPVRPRVGAAVSAGAAGGGLRPARLGPALVAGHGGPLPAPD